MNPPDVGSAAPQFILKDQFGADISLAGLVADRAALLVFYPFAFSGICTGELCGIRDDMPRFSNEDVQVVGISCDPMFSQRAWAEAEGFDFPLLSDFWPHGEVARAYGVFDESAGFSTRGTLLVDTSGTVRWRLINGPGEARDFTGALEAVAHLASASG